ncbi:tyrosine kinase family protein [Acinetobacter sp. 72431]|nr:tyrosine kinase family protein [Acinetobacter sp. 72431]KCX88932.1 tyrosine kinase family protein [Acinetobacter sp. 72431]
MDATPRYMAPELFRGGYKSIQSDLYAFGIVLYEWLTQTRLEASSYRDWAVLHCQNLTIQLPTQFLIFLPLLVGLLQKQQQNRFSNADEAINCLKQIQIDKNH